MSIDRWNKDASAHARIDALEKQIEDLRGYKFSHTLKTDFHPDEEVIGKIISKEIDRQLMPGGKLAK